MAKAGLNVLFWGRFLVYCWGAFLLFFSHTEKTTPIGRTAVREAGIFGQSWVPNFGHPLQPLGYYSTIVLIGLKGAFN